MKSFFTRFLLLLAETQPCIRRFFSLSNLDLLTCEHRITCIKVQILARLVGISISV